jgi:hypothetical protein
MTKIPHLLLFTLAPLSAQTVCEPTPMYGICDLVFDGPAEATLQAEVRSPRHRTFLMPAFASAPGKLTIRVSPTLAGQWDFRITSSLPAYNGRTGSFEALPNDHPGFVVPANLRHWATGEDRQPHLWLGATGGDPEQLAAQKFNHVRLELDQSRLDSIEKQIRAYNEKRITVDLVLRDLPTQWQEREKVLRYLIGRFAAFNITWQLEGTRAALKETGLALKRLDPYRHPRTAVTSDTTAPLLADGWADYILYTTVDDQLGAIEHQLYTAPKVSIALEEGKDPEEFRRRLWNMWCNGQYPTVKLASGQGARYVAAWQELFARTRHWDIEPYFDVDGARALALEGVEYIVYIEKPSVPVEVLVEKHSYDVYWFNPLTGEYTKEKKDWKGEKFVAQPPSTDHDWVLHLSRDGRKEGMLKSYKFESRLPMVQELEMQDKMLPFEIVEPQTDTISRRNPPAFSVKIRRPTRATRTMMFLWTGEVVTGGQGARVLGTGEKGQLKIPADMTRQYPAVLSLRVVGMNANGKIYAADKVVRLTE